MENEQGPLQTWQKGLYLHFAFMVESFLREMSDFGHPMRVTSGLRDASQQEIIYEQGRSRPGKIVTNAKPWDSMHNYGLAVDVCFRGPDPYADKSPQLWETVKDLADKFGLVWGGCFGIVDKPHLECTYGFTIHDLKKMIENGGSLDSVWIALDNARSLKK